MTKRTKDFVLNGTYFNEQGTEFILVDITQGDRVRWPLVCENIKTGEIATYTSTGGYYSDGSASVVDLIWQDQSEYSLTEFKRKISLFNEISGKSGVPSDEDIRNQVRLITEEAKEIKDALEQGEPEINLLQEALDVLVVTFGLIEQLKSKGYDVDKAMGKVVDCNLSKFTQDRTEAWKSMDSYHDSGTNVTVDYYEEHNVYVIKDENNKIRKPLNFKKVNLEDCKPKV
jgi:NTP pyrophosphatase (non-canonical NTP hydrolase)